MQLNFLELEKVSFKYPRSKKNAIENVSFILQPGEVLVLTGPSGSGKSTLLRVMRNLHKEYGGEYHGDILINGKSIKNTPAYDLGSNIAIIFQNPAYQLHQPRVIDEVLSAPMYQGLPWDECVSRAQETTRYFLPENFLTKNPADLSCGEQQKVVLAASLVMKANLILLDEPFSYLDLLSRRSLINIIKNLKSSGKTIVLITHDFDLVCEVADKIGLLVDGKLIDFGIPEKVLFSNQIDKHIGRNALISIGKKLINKGIVNNKILNWDQISSLLIPTIQENKEPIVDKKSFEKKEKIIEIDSLHFSYNSQKEILHDINVGVESGEIFGIFGKNGCGKSTLAKLIVGLLKPTKGEILINGKSIDNQEKRIASLVGYVPQFPGDMFFETSVFEECIFGPKNLSLDKPNEITENTLAEFGLKKLSNRDPRSLSSGQQRLLSIANITVNNPQIIILDEPEFGLDKKNRLLISNTLLKLRDQGKTIIIISHDIEFAIYLCDRLCYLNNKRVQKVGCIKEILNDKSLFTDYGLIENSQIGLLKKLIQRDTFPINEEDFIDLLEKSLSRENWHD